MNNIELTAEETADLCDYIYDHYLDRFPFFITHYCINRWLLDHDYKIHSKSTKNLNHKVKHIVRRLRKEGKIKKHSNRAWLIVGENLTFDCDFCYQRLPLDQYKGYRKHLKFCVACGEKYTISYIMNYVHYHPVDQEYVDAQNQRWEEKGY